jgi:tRNA threonylcarbamoyladenosine biosynthesis protein TsaB
LAARPEYLPTAAAVVRLALPRLRRGEAIDPGLAAPFYVRDKVAQTVAERLAGGGKA